MKNHMKKKKEEQQQQRGNKRESIATDNVDDGGRILQIKQQKSSPTELIARTLIRATQLVGTVPKVYTWRSTRDYFDGIIYN